MKLCPCGKVPTINSRLRTGHSIYCPDCGKSLTKDYPQNASDAVIVWVHGEEHLPPVCPICSLPPEVENAWDATPKVRCVMQYCPLHHWFELKEWNSKCRPRAWGFERLLQRWRGKPEFAKAARALAREIQRHTRGRYSD